VPTSPVTLWGAAVGLIALVATTSWFAPGTAVAGGDIDPPNGLAWISHIFAPWTWSGTDLGGPNGTAVQLPWAVALELVHHLGGSEATAQRLWMTVFFAGAGIAAYGALRLLALSPVACFVGALAYIFNPYTMSAINNNPVWMVALCCLAAISCCVLAVGTGRLRVRHGTIALAALAPLIGYTYENPPLVLLLAAGAVVAALAAVALDGRPALRRCLHLGLCGVPLLLALCAYWLVPAIIQSGVAASDTLSTVGSGAGRRPGRRSPTRCG
jgi:hypothetical protein